MHRIITSKFELDLTPYKVSIVEENHWFSDVFFTKYSFPFDMDLSDDFMQPLGHLLDHCYVNGETLFECVYVHGAKQERAVFEVESIRGFRITASLRYGFEELSSFSKKLSELSLDKFDLPEGTTIYQYAATIIPQTWPAVNFNFPQIHIDKIDTDSDIWFAFDKIINNYKSGAFLENTVDLEQEITYNRNIMQPLPSFMHILTRGFADSGYILKGDITTDPVFIKKLLYGDVDYVTTVEQESLSMLVMSEDAVIVNGRAIYQKSIVITTPGRYRINLDLTMRIGQLPSTSGVLYRSEFVMGESTFTWPWEKTFTGGGYAIIDTLSDDLPDTITFVSVQYPMPDGNIIADININPIRLHDDTGAVIPSVINKNVIDLPRAVPDITFADFVKYIKNKFNVDVDIRGNEVWMNFIQNEMDNIEVLDLSNYEVENPARKFNKGISFILKFQDINSTEYSYAPIFHSATEISANINLKNEKTNEIVLDGLPLPLLVRSGVQTAHAFESSSSKIFSVLYDGLNSAGLNLTIDPTPILIPAIHERHNKDWFNQRLDGTEYNWDFKFTPEQLRALKAKGVVFAYGRNHVVKTVNKTQSSEDHWDIDITTETLK